MSELEELKDNLEDLKVQAARHGMTIPLDIKNNIEWHEEKIKELEEANEHQVISGGRGIAATSSDKPVSKLKLSGTIATSVGAGVIILSFFMLLILENAVIGAVFLMVGVVLVVVGAVVMTVEKSLRNG